MLANEDAPMEHGSSRRIEIVVPLRTMVQIAAFLLVVALAILSLGTLISIFLAAVIALGIDPLVGSLVQRGWKRGIAALTVFAGLFGSLFVIVIVTAGPVWGEIKAFVAELP